MLCVNSGDDNHSKPEATGLGNNYYNLPDDAHGIQDLIEWKKMDFSIGNIFKACYRFGEKPDTTKLYDAEKINWFSERIIAELKREIKRDKFNGQPKAGADLDYGNGG